MKDIDLNLIPALKVLLEERNVARAARRMNLSQSAMSRTLARLRDTMNDPVLVRAGRGLVPSPRALEIQAQVARISSEVEEVLRPVTSLHIGEIERTFTLLTSDGFVESIGGTLIQSIAEEAPGIRIRFLSHATAQGNSLRDGSVDIETGKLSELSHPELIVQRMFDDEFIGVVQKGHPLSRNTITQTSYLQAGHIGVCRNGQRGHHLASLLDKPEDELDVRALVGSYSSAVALARSTPFIATVPEKHTESLRKNMHSFALPFNLPSITISMFWHPRMNADLAHRWLREEILAISQTL
ncbi:LysR family transcriptional regulator [Vibrio proteolyticus]